MDGDTPGNLGTDGPRDASPSAAGLPVCAPYPGGVALMSRRGELWLVSCEAGGVPEAYRHLARYAEAPEVGMDWFEASLVADRLAEHINDAGPAGLGEQSEAA